MTMTPESAGVLSRREKQELLRKLLVERSSRVRTAPASFAQERLWLLDRMQATPGVYNVPQATRLPGVLDVPALERALGEVVRRHEALRTTLQERDGPFPGFALPVEELAGRGAAEVRRLVWEEAMRPFDLAAGPLFRARLLRLGPEEHVLPLCMHHVAGDGWSPGVLFRELSAPYGRAPGAGPARGRWAPRPPRSACSPRSAICPKKSWTGSSVLDPENGIPT